MIDITEILVHWYAGRSQHDVAGSLGVARNTIRRYVEPAIAAGFVPGGPPVSEAEWAALVQEWFPHLTDTRLRQVTWPEFDRHREYIAEQLRAGVTKATIHQRLRDEHGMTGSLASLKRYVAANLAEDAVREKVTVLRADPEPGLEARIDYGMLGSWTDPRTGRSQRIWAFVMVLSHSRHMFVRPVISMDQASWTASHVEAFAFFGGYVGDFSSAISRFRSGWSLPSRSAHGLAALSRSSCRYRRQSHGRAGARPGGRLLGVRRGALPPQHAAGNRL